MEMSSGKRKGIPFTREERLDMFNNELARQQAGGKRIESQTDFQAVLVTGKPVNHVLHLLLTVFTAGLWIFVWLLLAFSGGEKREILQVDELGVIKVYPLKKQSSTTKGYGLP